MEYLKTLVNRKLGFSDKKLNPKQLLDKVHRRYNKVEPIVDKLKGLQPEPKKEVPNIGSGGVEKLRRDVRDQEERMSNPYNWEVAYDWEGVLKSFLSYPHDEYNKDDLLHDMRLAQTGLLRFALVEDPDYYEALKEYVPALLFPSYEDFKNAVEENKYKYPWVSDQDSALQDLSEMGPLDSKEALKNYLKAVYNNWKNSYDSITEENKGNYIDGDNLWGFKRDTLRRYGHHKFEDVRAIPNVDDPYNGEEFKGKN